METLILFIVSSCVICTVYPLTKSDFSFYPDTSVSRETGKINCEKEGKKLLRIENSQKWDDLLSLDTATITPTLIESTYWISLLTYSSDCTAYVWGGYDPVCAWTNWQDGQPADCNSNKCVKVEKGKWSTTPCTGEMLPYICERITPGMCTGGGLVVEEKPTTTTTSTTTTAAETTTSTAETTTPEETTTSVVETTTTSAQTTTSVAETTTTSAQTTTNVAETTTTPVETTTTTSAAETMTSLLETPTSATETSTSAAETASIPSETTSSAVETTTEMPPSGGNEHTTTIQQSPGIGGVGGFVEHREKAIVDTNLVSSIANPVALTITGNVDSCKQTCLDTKMNSFQCWAVTTTSASSNECILYYIDEPSTLRASSVLVIATGSVVFLKSQASVPTLGTACSCKPDFNWDPPGNVSEQYVLEMLEKLLQLKGKLSIKKNETQKYQRTLISAEDKRASAVGIGSMGIALLVVIFGFVVVADITHFISLFKYLKKCCQRKVEAVPP